MITIQFLERVGRVAPLGCRFYDPVTDQVVYEGLQVTAYLQTEPEKRRQAVVTRSGAFGFRGLPDLVAVEFGEGDDEYWRSIVSTRKAAVEVLDLQERFQPFWFEIDVPVRGLVLSVCNMAASPPNNAVGIGLYSTPTRPVKDGMAVLRAQLWDAEADGPASWTHIEIWASGTLLGQGVADQQGRLAIIFPYPDLVNFSLGSPPPTGQPLHQQVWALELRAYYKRWNPVPDIPNLCEMLAQSPATLWGEASPLSPLGPVQLEYGKELTVRSLPHSELLMSTVGSPP